MSIYVINKKASSVKVKFGDLVEYVGRPNPLGNPFKIGKGHGGRDAVIEKYRHWLWNQINGKPLGSNKAIAEIERLANAHYNGRNIYLQCWCAPKRCHAHVIKKAIQWFCKNREEGIESKCPIEHKIY